MQLVLLAEAPDYHSIHMQPTIYLGSVYYLLYVERYCGSSKRSAAVRYQGLGSRLSCSILKTYSRVLKRDFSQRI